MTTLQENKVCALVCFGEPERKADCDKFWETIVQTIFPKILCNQ